MAGQDAEAAPPGRVGARSAGSLDRAGSGRARRRLLASPGSDSQQSGEAAAIDFRSVPPISDQATSAEPPLREDPPDGPRR